jgi:hypothetical protein
VEVHCDEGVAIHIGPQPCVHARESMGEASVGERVFSCFEIEARMNVHSERSAGLEEFAEP